MTTRKTAVKMDGEWWKCETNNLHRSQADAAACPRGHMSIKPTVRRARRHAVPQRLVFEPDVNAQQGATTPAPSPSPSWATVSDSAFTPQPSRDHTPAPSTPLLQAVQTAYPTPGASQSRARTDFVPSKDGYLPIFTARSASPGSSPDPDTFTSLWTSQLDISLTEPGSFRNDGFGFPTRERRNAIIPPDAEEIERVRELAARFEREDTAASFGSGSHIDDDNITPTMTTPQPRRRGPSFTISSQPNTITAASHRFASLPPPAPTTEQEILELHNSRRSLITHLRDSTNLINKLAARESLALRERDRAVESERLTLEELKLLKAQRRKQWLAVVKLRCFVLLASILAVLLGLHGANRWLYAEEFEWVRRRTAELLGV